ncbi:MAG: hypothetical protein OEZ54_05450, partial [Gemmatimonadota bacterium]|nr:hypothetical protein [Gemmatimonadota bacterium]
GEIGLTGWFPVSDDSVAVYWTFSDRRPTWYAELRGDTVVGTALGPWSNKSHLAALRVPCNRTDGASGL